MLPIERTRSNNIDTEDGAMMVLELWIARDLFWFRGHFSRQPILPGVAQLDWVMRYAVEHLAPGWHFSVIENIKFQQPVFPDTRLRLTLNWHAVKHAVSFTYHILTDDEAQIASSGKIKLAPDSGVTPCH